MTIMGASSRLHYLVTRIAILLAVLLLYIPALHNDYVWDDAIFLFDDSQYTATNDVLAAITQPFFVSENYFRPLPLLSFALEAHLAGMANPVLSHAVNIALHLLNTFLILIIIEKLLSHSKQSLSHRQAIIATTTGGLFYGLHPALIESVAWVSVRFDLLMTTFLLALIATAITNKSTVKGALSGLLYLMAALSKELTAIFPFTLICIYGFQAQSLSKQRINIGALLTSDKLRVYACIILAGILYLVLRYASLGYILADERHLDYGNLLQHLLAVGKSYSRYFILTIWPFTISSPLHPTSIPVPLYDISAWIGLTTTLAAFFLSAALIKRGYAIGWLLLGYLVSLLPVSHILPLTIGNNIAHERFLVFPLAFAAFSVAYLLTTEHRLSGAMLRATRISASLIIGIWTLLSTLHIHATVPLWHDNETLWKWALTRHPESAYAKSNLAAYYIKSGNYSDAKKYLEEVLSKDIYIPSVQVNYGILLLRHENKPEQAIAHLKFALDLMNGTAYRRLMAIAKSNIGIAYLVLEQPEKALPELMDAIALQPYNGGFHLNLATGLAKASRIKEAEQQLMLAKKLMHPKEFAKYKHDATAFIERLAQNRSLKP